MAAFTEPWHNPETWERHVRSTGGLSVLDLTVATSQLYGGFSSFRKAAEDLKRNLPPKEYGYVLQLCEKHRVEDAFRARREAVNLKKFALRTLWSAEELEKKLLRISLVCSVGDSSRSPLDVDTAKVYFYEKDTERMKVAEDGHNAETADGGAEEEASLEKNLINSSFDLKVKKVGRPATKQELEDYTSAGIALLTTRALIALASDLRVFVKRACRHPRHPDGDLRHHLIAPPLGFRVMKFILKARDFINYSFKFNETALKPSLTSKSNVELKHRYDLRKEAYLNFENNKATNIESMGGGKKRTKHKGKSKSKGKNESSSEQSQNEDGQKTVSDNDKSVEMNNDVKTRPFKYVIDFDHLELNNESDINGSFLALIKDIRAGQLQDSNNNNNEDSLQNKQSANQKSDNILALPWVADYVEKVLVARGVYKAMCIQNKLLQLSNSFAYIAEVAAYSLAMINEHEQLLKDHSLIASFGTACVNEKPNSISDTSEKGEEEEGDMWTDARGLKWRQQRDNHEVSLSPLIETANDLAYWCKEASQLKNNDTSEPTNTSEELESKSTSPTLPSEVAKGAIADVLQEKEFLFTAGDSDTMKAPHGFQMTALLNMPMQVEADLRVRRLGLTSRPLSEDNQVTISTMDTMGKLPCLRCSNFFSKAFIMKSICYKCEHELRLEGRCPFSYEPPEDVLPPHHQKVEDEDNKTKVDTQKQSKKKKFICPLNLWCPHHLRCICCESSFRACHECRLYQATDGEGVAIFEEELAADVLFLDFDRTFCSTKFGAAPVYQKHVPDFDLLKLAKNRLFQDSLLLNQSDADEERERARQQSLLCELIDQTKAKEKLRADKKLTRNTSFTDLGEEICEDASESVTGENDHPIQMEDSLMNSKEEEMNDEEIQYSLGMSSVYIITRNSHVKEIQQWLKMHGCNPAAFPVVSVQSKKDYQFFNSQETTNSDEAEDSVTSSQRYASKAEAMFDILDKRDEWLNSQHKGMVEAHNADSSLLISAVSSKGSKAGYTRKGCTGMFVDDSSSEISELELVQSKRIYRVFFGRY